MVYRLGVFNRWIDEPYLIRLRPGNSVEFIEQSGSTPDKITIPLSQTQFTTVEGFIDSTFCAGANVDFSFFASDSLRTTAINYLDTLKIVGRGGTTVFFDTLTQKYIITSSGSGGAGTDLSFSGTSSPVTLNSSTGTDVTITAGAGNSLSATGTNVTITATDQSATNEAQSLASGTNTVTLSAVSGFGGGTVTVDTNPSDDVTGSGTKDYLAVFTDTKTIGNSALIQDTVNSQMAVGLNITPTYRFEISTNGGPGQVQGMKIQSAGGWVSGFMDMYSSNSPFQRGINFGATNSTGVRVNDLFTLNSFDNCAGINKKHPLHTLHIKGVSDTKTVQVETQADTTKLTNLTVNSQGDGIFRSTTGFFTFGKASNSVSSMNPNAAVHLFGAASAGVDTLFALEKSGGFGITRFEQFYNAGTFELGTHFNVQNNRVLTLSTLFGGSPRVGVNTPLPTQTLHVTGTARITGSTGTSTTITGRNANGDISNVGVGSGLSLSSGSLSVSAAGLSKWTLSGSDIYNTALGNVAVGTSGTTVSKFRVSGNSASTCARLDAGTLDGFGSNLLLSGSSSSSIFAINSRHSANGNVLHEFTNQYNTSTSAHSIVQVNSGGSGGGDPLLQLKVQGESDNVVIGVDNDELNKFRISRSDALSTGNESGLTILTDSKTGVNEIDPPYMFAVNGTDGIGFPSGTTLERPAISMPVIRFNNNIGGFEAGATNNAWYRISSTQTPTVTWNSGVIGTGGSVTFTSGSNDVCGTLVITTGATPTGTNVSAITIVFATAYNTVTPFGMIAARNAITATEWNKFHIGTTNTLQMAIGVAAALAPSTEYRINYRIQQ